MLQLYSLHGRERPCDLAVKFVAQFRRHGEELDPATVAAVFESYGDKFVPRFTFLNSGLPMQMAITPYGGVSFRNQSLNLNEQHRRNAAEDLAEFLTAP